MKAEGEKHTQRQLHSETRGRETETERNKDREIETEIEKQRHRETKRRQIGDRQTPTHPRTHRVPI